MVTVHSSGHRTTDEQIKYGADEKRSRVIFVGLH